MYIYIDTYCERGEREGERERASEREREREVLRDGNLAAQVIGLLEGLTVRNLQQHDPSALSFETRLTLWAPTGKRPQIYISTCRRVTYLNLAGVPKSQLKAEVSEVS